MRDARPGIAALAATASLELVDPERHRAALERLDPAHAVFVASLRADDDPLLTTIPRALAVRRLGLTAVPHIAVRNYRDLAHLERALARLGDGGVTAILLLAGDRATCGVLPDTLAVLRTDIQMFRCHGIGRVHIAGHPDGSPHAGKAELTAALCEKSEILRAAGLAGEIVTQFCSDPRRVIAWAHAAAAAGNAMPVRMGIGGPVRSLPRLLRTMIRIGAAPSAIAHAAPAMLLDRLRHPRARGAASCMQGIITAARHPDLIAGIHLYSFGEFDAAADLLSRLSPSPVVA